MSGEMVNVNFDNVDIGLQVSATASDAMNVQIANLTLANDGGGTNHIGIEGLPGTAQIAVTGACFGGQIYQPVTWNNSGLLSLSMGRFLSWQTSLPAINILSGQAILQGNYFSSNSAVAIRTGNNTTRALIVGNMLFGNSVAAGPNTYSSGNQP
jgi:hypothetical protein